MNKRKGGRIVELKDGKRGRLSYIDMSYVKQGDKVPVVLEDDGKKVLCDLKTLNFIGFFD